MTVKDIFALRKKGKIEEAYEAIRPMYAAHKGKYTTLCMFWTAADVFKLRLEQGRTEEASKIYEALKRMLPRIEEITKELDKQHDQKGTISGSTETKDVVAKKTDENLPWESNKPQHSGHSAASFLQYAAHRLAATVPSGSLAAVVPAGSPAVPPAPTVLTGSAGETHSPHSPNHGSDVPPLPRGQKKVFDCIKTDPGLSVPRISASTRIPAKSIERHIPALIDKKLIEHRGSKKTGGYYAL